MTWRVEIYLTASSSLFYRGPIRKDGSEQLPIIQRVQLLRKLNSLSTENNLRSPPTCYMSVSPMTPFSQSWLWGQLMYHPTRLCCISILWCSPSQEVVNAIPTTTGSSHLAFAESKYPVDYVHCRASVYHELGAELVLVSWVLYDLTPIGALGLVRLCRYWFKMELKWCCSSPALGITCPAGEVFTSLSPSWLNHFNICIPID